MHLLINRLCIVYGQRKFHRSINKCLLTQIKRGIFFLFETGSYNLLWLSWNSQRSAYLYLPSRVLGLTACTTRPSPTGPYYNALEKKEESQLPLIYHGKTRLPGYIAQLSSRTLFQDIWLYCETQACTIEINLGWGQAEPATSWQKLAIESLEEPGR